MVDRILRVVREPVRWVPWLLASLPALWMAWFVLQGSHLQYADYWAMMPRDVTPSGGLDLAGLFTFQNVHPVVIPQFLYWLNLHATAGSNIWLGLVVVAIVCVQVVLISLYVAPTDRRKWAAASIIVVASVLLFSPQGVHNFTRSMSGTAWLTANLFVVAAILARSRDRAWLAGGLAVAASLSYGTGLVVWPVLLVVGMLRDRRWLPDWRVLALGVGPVILYFMRRSSSDNPFRPSLRDAVEGALSIGGSLFTSTPDVMQIMALIGGLVGLGLIGVALWKRVDGATVWIGLFLYAVGGMAIIAYGRFLLIGGDVFPSRYASLGALFWIALFGLAGSVLHWQKAVLVPAGLLVVAALSFTSPSVAVEREGWSKQDDLAAAMRLHLAHDRAYTYAFIGYIQVDGLLEELGHYPFSGAYDGDCGLLGDTYRPQSIEKTKSGHIDSVRSAAEGEGLRIIAELPDVPRDDIACVVVGDDQNRVVGIGTLGIGEQTTAVGMSNGAVDDDRLAAIAPIGSSIYRVLLVLDDDRLLQVGGDIKESRITGR